MPLKLTLKPHEKLIIAGAVVTNGDVKCDLIIENKVPILREKDVMREEDAISPCSKIFFVVQLMYVDPDNIVDHHNAYWNLVREVIKAAPSMINLISRISEEILSSNYYKALKLSKQLIDYEKEVVSYVRKPIGSV